MNPIVVVLPGVAAGLALATVAVALAKPAPVHLPAALARLDSRRRNVGEDAARPGRIERLLVPVAVRAARSNNRWWGLPTAELDTCEITPTRYIAHRLAWAAAGGAVAAVLAVVAGLSGLGTATVLVPLVVVGGVAGSMVPVLDVAEAARARRTQFRDAIATYLDLVAQERAAGAAATPALIDAAAVGDSWPFRRLRSTLIRSEHSGQPGWEALAELGNRMHVPELGDVADIVATAADGAAVYTTLTTKATSLRRSALAADKAAANAASQRLTVPVTLLLVGLLLIVLYPALIRLVGS